MIKVALVGIGNCASALVQGVSYYRQNSDAPGLIIKEVCGFTPSDIEFTSAFDVDSSKVGFSLDKAIFSGKNNTIKISDNIENASCIVAPAPVFDGAGRSYREKIDLIEPDEYSEYNVNKILSSSKPDVLVNYLPVGSEQATQFWAKKCIEYNIGFINAIPSFIVSDPKWAKQFSDSKTPCVGDDVKSQVGATIIHRALVHLFSSRGAKVDSTYQLNFGGNMDFYNMLEDGRLISKKKSKLSSVRHEIPNIEENMIHISPTDYIQFLEDQKIAYINIIGRGFAGTPMEVECKLKVWDSPNSAGVVIDLIRFVAAAKIAGHFGPLPICPFYFKSPPYNLTDVEAEKIAYETASKIVKM